MYWSILHCLNESSWDGFFKAMKSYITTLRCHSASLVITLHCILQIRSLVISRYHLWWSILTDGDAWPSPMIHDCALISKSGQSSPFIVIICFSRIPLTAMASWSPLPQCQARVCQRWTQGWLPPHRLLLLPLRLAADSFAGSLGRTLTLTAPETSSPA